MIKEKSVLFLGRYPSPLVNNRGSILVLSLWAIMVLGIFSISVGYNVRQKISLADRLDRRNTLYGIAGRGVARGISQIRERKISAPTYDALNSTWFNEEKLFHDVDVGPGTFSVWHTDSDNGQQKIHYGMEDEESRININTADPVVLSRFLQIMTGIDDEAAKEIAYSIVDWRDKDNSLSHPNYGAEDDYYQDLDPPYTCKDNPFETVQELLLVRGMSKEIFEKIKDDVTVYGSGKVNINTAKKETLLGLGLSQVMVQKILSYRASSDREEGTQDDLVFTQPANIAADLSKAFSLSSEEVAEISNLSSVLETTTGAFRIRSTGAIGERIVMVIEAVADPNGKILYWNAGMPIHVARQVQSETSYSPLLETLKS